MALPEMEITRDTGRLGAFGHFGESGDTGVLISSYLPEILELSDRILVAKSGTIAAEFSRAEATAERILHAAVH